MPTPLVGQGAAISKGLQRFQYAFYIAAASSGATFPSVKLGASEPTGGWVRVGRLRFDDIGVNIADAQMFEGRAGWAKALQFRAVQQAEDVKFTLDLDERDPDVQSKLRNTTATSLSSGSSTGQEFIYKAGQSFAAKVLIVGIAADPSSTREHHLYMGKTIVTYKLTNQADYEGLQAMVYCSDVSSVETYRDREWD